MVINNKHTIKCDLCHGEFNLSQDNLSEVQVTLNKEGLASHDVILTILNCPICGKNYIVIMDDAKTEALATKLRSITVKQAKSIRMGKPSAVLEQKYRDAQWKLNFYRQKLAEKYIGSTYQLEGVIEQLDYRHQAR